MKITRPCEAVNTSVTAAQEFFTCPPLRDK